MVTSLRTWVRSISVGRRVHAVHWTTSEPNTSSFSHPPHYHDESVGTRFTVVLHYYYNPLGLKNDNNKSDGIVINCYSYDIFYLATRNDEIQQATATSAIASTLTSRRVFFKFQNDRGSGELMMRLGLHRAMCLCPAMVVFRSECRRQF